MTTEESRGRSGSDVETTSVDDIRAGVRTASTSNSPYGPVAGKFAALLDANDGAHTGTTPRRTRRPVRDLHALGERLSERDWSILRSVSEHRFLTVPQIQTLHFGDLPEASGLRTAQRVLARLRHERLVQQLTRRIGGHRAGSSGVVYYLDDVGERLLRADTGAIARRRFHEPTNRFLDHQLAIADAHVALIQADRAGQLELLRCDIEPTAWRTYMGIGGARLTLKPDLYAEVATPPDSEYVDTAFIEIDKGTESIPTLIKKCREYEAYRRQGIEQESSDGAFPFVIWSMSADTEAKAERRRTALREAIDRDRTLSAALFRIIPPEQLIATMQKGAEV
ncbi:replication-relaxation family protein [Nocardia cyriacigeorgica]|uniref:replication-relaxation family protein n=1 Tax=Nocardia cyriacigeorgica TaxID=135487 RepID=UPI001E2A71CE|nr:replication-relaxation family protein [Nocardia cyriacigeorgica]